MALKKQKFPVFLAHTQTNQITEKPGICWYSQAELGLGINLAGKGGFCCVPAFHPSRLQLTSAHTHLHTHGLIFQGLVLFGQRCANRRCNTSPDRSQKQGRETRWPNKQPTLSQRERERGDFSGFTETHAKTHTQKHKKTQKNTHALARSVCNSSLYLRAWASGYLFKRLSKQS